MFDVISTAKSTQWNAFPTLCSVYSYPHVSNEAVDFQVIPGKNCFVEFNKKFGFELLRTVNKDSKESIQRIKKRPVDDLSCGAISKVTGGQIALGLTTGFIRMFNVQTGDYVPIKFKPDRVGNSVVGLDYSNTDEYLAAVYDNYDISLFGLNTGVKMDTIRLAGLSTMVRFHPVRKFALAVGSYEGDITVMDVQTKKKLFYDKNAESAPVRDISMYESSQDLFVSCGYDCSIKVFDLRKRSVVQNHKQPHPMSTVCISPCGMFCVAGNLKGDVISYDFRNMAQPLDTKRVYDSAVVRVAFVPSVTSDSNLTLDHTANAISLDSVSHLSGSTGRQTSSHDSFAKFVDVCHFKNSETTELLTPKRRDSWSDLMQTMKVVNFSVDSAAETPCIYGKENQSESILSMQSRLSLNQSHEQEPTKHIATMSNPAIQIHASSEKKEKSVIESKRRRLTDAVPLEGIVEETCENDNGENPQNTNIAQKISHKEFANGFAAYIKKVFDENNEDATTKGAGTIVDAEEDKENHQDNHQQRISTESITHTPARHAYNTKESDNGEMITVKVNELNKIVNERVGEIMVTLEAEFEKNMQKWQENVMKYMENKLKEVTSHVGYMQSRYFRSDFNNRFVSHMQLEDEIALFEEGIASLLHTQTVQDQYPMYEADLTDLQRRFNDQQKLNHQ